MGYTPTEWVNGDQVTPVKLNAIEQGVLSVNSDYTPTTWVSGDIVTASKLNNIEQGIANAGGGGGGDSFATNEVAGTLDKTWQEIHDALEELGVGKVFIYSTYEDGGETTYRAFPVASCTSEEGYYEVAGYYDGTAPNVFWFTESADGYPIVD